MKSLYKTFLLVISTAYLFSSQGQAADSKFFKEDEYSRGIKRDRSSYEFDDSDPRKEKEQEYARGRFIPFRSKERDSQFRLLTRQSYFVEGEESARLVWAQTLHIFSGSKTPDGFVEIPADIHDELAYVGNHLRAFAQQNSAVPQSFKRNILIPHVSFVVKRHMGEFPQKLFIPGSYINFEREKYSDCATAFISGGDSMPWSALKPYNDYRSTHNSDEDRDYDLPFVRIFSGREVEKIIGKKLPSVEQSSSDQIEYLYHTEEMFYEMFLANPHAVVDQALEVLLPIDEIVHVVFDFFSWWDVCKPCQKRFRTEYFRGVVHQQLEQAFDEADFGFSKDAGILPIFRVSSYKQHHADSLQDMAFAGKGIPGRSGYEAKGLSQMQIIISTRKTTGSFNYSAILGKIKALGGPSTYFG